MHPLYLNPGAPRWTPTTEEDLLFGISNDLMRESHHLELKRKIPSGKSANKELARDLASLAVDGGALIVGIAELDGASPDLRLAPFALAGMRERIEAVSRSIPDPALSVLVQEIPSAADASAGFLVVHVPPSSTAPHMVDGKYLGRGDAAKQYLSDAEVRRLHERRSASESDLLSLLDREIERDPVPVEVREQAHLFLMAEPLHARPEMLLEHLHEQALRQLLVDGVWNGEAVRALGEQQRFSPDLASATTYSRRARGAAFSSTQLLPGRGFQPDRRWGAEDVVDIEVTEEGAVHIFLGRFSDSVSRDGAPARQFLFDAAAVMYTRQLLGLIVEITGRTGYLGAWGLAVGATGLEGLTSYDNHRYGGAVDADTYRRATHASHADLLAAPGRLAQQLLGRLLRNLGTAGAYAQELSDPPVPANDISCEKN